MSKIIKWLKDLFLEEYVVTIWFKGGTDFEPTETKRTYKFKAIKKKTQTHFIGIDKKGHYVEVKTTVPFDFRIEKIH